MKNLRFKAVPKNLITRQAIAVLISAVVLVIAAAVNYKNPIVEIVLYAISLAAAGYDMALNAIESILDKRFSFNIFITLGVLIMFVSRHYEEAALVAIIFLFGEIIKNYIETELSRKLITTVEGAPKYRVLGKDDAPCTANELKIGDVVRAASGDFLCFDGEIQSGDSNKKVYAGEYGGDGAEVKVTAVYDYTIDFDKSAADKKSKFTQLASKVKTAYVLVVVVAAVLYTAFSVISGKYILDILYVASGLILLISPCALTEGFSVSGVVGMFNCSAVGIKINDAAQLESLGGVGSVVINKTGVMTRGQYSVAEVFAADGYDKNDVLAVCAAVQNDKSDKIGAAVTESAAELNVQPIKCEFIPSMGFKGEHNGKQLLVGSKSLMAQYGVDVSALPEVSVYAAVGTSAIGAIRLSDKLMSDSVNAVKMLKAYGINTVIASADNAATVDNIAKMCGADKAYGLLDSEKKAEIVAESKAKAVTAYVGDDDMCAEAADISAPSASGLLGFAGALIFAKKRNTLSKLKLIIAAAVNLVLAALTAAGIFRPWYTAVAIVAVTLIYAVISSDAPNDKK